MKYPRFLDNKPCGKDLFEGNSHEIIAQNIVNVIDNSNSKIIGIDGGWGSGKSNMVNLIKGKLDNNKFHFFIYDAWGHQTDFQRRSILENLTSFLVDEEKILKDKWNGKLLQLLSRKRSVGTKVVKELNAIAKVSALIAFTMPLLIFFDGLIVNSLGKLFYWGGVVFISLFLLYYLQIKSMKKYGQIVNFSNFMHGLFLSYMDYTNEKDKDGIEQTMKYETIYDEEPSSRDFRNWMKDINKDLKDNKLIVVFDNMDRLPKEKVQELWASIHAFFSEEKYENIFVIVPFDREHIKSAFKSEDFYMKQESYTGEVLKEETKVCFGNDFINKTFDAVYRVSPPVMSDWKLYFVECWKNAFGYIVENEVTQIYDILSKKITPREIIAFINEFVSIKQLLAESIPDKYIALFIKGKDVISMNPEEEILFPSYLGALDFMYKNDPELPKYISALFYQLPTEKALDIIYTENIKKALDNGEIELIEKMQDKPQLMFPILENAITKVSNISNTVKVLNECLKCEHSQQEQMIWNCVYGIVKLQIIKEPLQQYQKILLTKIKNKEEYLQKILLDLYNIQDLDVINYYNSIKQLSEIEGVDPFVYLCEKEVDAKSFISFVEQAKEDFYKYLITCKQDKLDEYLLELNVEQLSKLKAIPYIKDKFDITSFKNKLEKLFDSNVGNKSNIKIIYDRFKEIERPIKKRLSDQQIYNYFNLTKPDDEFYYDLICMRISCLNKFSSSYQSVFNGVLNSNFDADVVEKVAKRIEYYINYGDILLNIDKMSYLLYKEVAKKLTEKSYGQSKIDIVLVLQKYKMIKDNLEIDANVLIERLNGLSKYVKLNITGDNINSLPIIFFKDIITINNDIATYGKEFAIEYLKEKSKEEWKDALIDNNYDYQLLMIFGLNLQDCFDAFKELLLDKVNGNNKLSKEIIASMIDLFEANDRELLSAFNNVRDCFCDKGVEMTIELFDFYGEWLLQYSKLEDKKSALRKIFSSGVLDKIDNVLLILKYQDKMIKIVEKANEESRDFKDKIKSLLEGKYKDNEDFKIFANKIGIVQDVNSEHVN